MGLVDKIKNALFEVEYVEVDKDDTKKEKAKEKEIKKEEEKEQKDKPIAKRVILSSHKKESTKENLEDIKEDKVEDLKVENTAEINIEQPKQNEFKVMDDNDFKVDDYSSISDEPKIFEKPMYEKPHEDEFPKEERVIYRQETREKYPYGIDEASKNLVQDYGKAYEKKEERTGFKPSPIISPIYGVLDKNYRKEDVREKNNVRLSSYSRENMNVDDVRNKAYGSVEEKPKKVVKEVEIMEPEEKSIIVEEDDDTNLLVDLSKENGKPSVKEVTMGDALEYFQDLGLEYNVDYMDASKEKASGRRVKDDYNDGPELFNIEEKKEKIVTNEENTKPPVVETNDIDVENDDNLFDLIDSMYDEEK